MRIFTVTNHAYDEPFAPPPAHPLFVAGIGHPGWHQVDIDYQQRGVAIVWCCELPEPPDSAK